MATGIQVLWITISAFLICGSHAKTSPDDGDDPAEEIKLLRNVVGALTRQVMLQQFFVEERIRSDGDSGVKQIRHTRDGTRNYHSDSHGNNYRLMSYHNHPNHERTVGLGEFVAVLNGVEFRTRHNDYSLSMPNKASQAYHAMEPILFPDVPPEVENKGTVDEQIAEMREWFSAWKSQDHTTKDYRKYFKPVLCYLEGAWTDADIHQKVDEPFESERHFIDATSWLDLHQKIRFTSYTGGKHFAENLAYLPTTIINTNDETNPVFAQWNYRILCHPISRDIPLNRFRVVDEFFARLPNNRTYEEQQQFQNARFQLNPADEDTWTDGVNNKKWTLMDELMSEIPGKDNYLGDITDDAFDLEAQSIDPNKPGRLNAAYYHRWFKVLETDAMGQSTRHRGFADANVFMALNTQPDVTGMQLTTCSGPKKKQVCKTVNQKMSYAIPLEIIYLTPLSKWNPYDLLHKGPASEPLGMTVTAGGRNGGATPETAFDGTNSETFYRTPVEFFGKNQDSLHAADAAHDDPRTGVLADTGKDPVGVLDKHGNMRFTQATGPRVFFPPIDGVGALRQRYPIMPVHGEGSPVWKELEATKDLLMMSQTYGYLYREPLGGNGALPEPPSDLPLTLMMQYAKADPPGAHTHEIILTAMEVELAKEGVPYTKTTSEMAGHSHTITVIWGKGANGWVIQHCDDYDTNNSKCKDKHGNYLIAVPSSETN